MAALTALSLLAGCEHIDNAGETAGKNPLIIAAVAKQDVPLIAAGDGDVLVMSEREGVLGVQRALDEQFLPLGPVAPNARITLPTLLQRGGSIIALWMETTVDESGGRSYSSWMRVSGDGGLHFSDARVIGEIGQYVSAAEVTMGPDGVLWIITLEAAKEKENGSALTLYKWREDGLETIPLLEGDAKEKWRDIRLVANEGHAWVAWVAQQEGGAALQLMQVDTEGRPAPVETVTSTSFMIGMKLLRTPGGLMAYWMDLGNQIVGLSRNDGEGEWHEIVGMPSQLDGMLNGYSVNVAPDGAVHLLYAMREEEGDRPAVFHRLSRNGRTFGDAQRLNTGMSPYLATATMPEIAFDSSGKRVLVSYLDFRLFRPALFGNYSHDGGMTWLENDVPLSSEPSKRVVLSGRLVSLGGDKFALAWTESPDSSMSERYTVVRIIDISDFAKHAAIPQPDPGKLRGRIEQYWQARVAGEHAATFELFDPFFRQWSNVDAYVQGVTRFKVMIHDFEIADMTEITPLRYRVNIRYEHELEEMTTPQGIKMGIPRNWVDTEQEWIWIDGNWHLVYVDIMKKPLVVY